MRRTCMPYLTIPVALVAALTLLFGGAAPAAEHTMDKHSLTFRGDDSFQGAHGGDPIRVALVNAETGDVVAKQSGTVSANGNRAFVFEFDNAMPDETPVEIHYWIDSNFGGGSQGACDPKQTDHQWQVDLGEVVADMHLTRQHEPGNTTSVCGSFGSM